MGKEPREFIKNLEIGKTYILVWFDFIFIGILKDKTWRNESYEVLVFESEQQYISNRNEVSKMLHKEGGKTQLYCTNSIIFENNIIDGKYYDWFMSKMKSVNISKVNGKNTIVNTGIAKSMIIKDLSKILQRRELSLFEDILNSKGVILVQNYQKKYRDIVSSQEDQMPFNVEFPIKKCEMYPELDAEVELTINGQTMSSSMKYAHEFFNEWKGHINAGLVIFKMKKLCQKK